MKGILLVGSFPLFIFRASMHAPRGIRMGVYFYPMG